MVSRRHKESQELHKPQRLKPNTVWYSTFDPLISSLVLLFTTYPIQFLLICPGSRQLECRSRDEFLRRGTNPETPGPELDESLIKVGVAVLMTWVPGSNQAISFATVSEQARANADTYDCDCSIIGPRFDSLYANHLKTLHNNKLIEVDLETEEILEITPEGKRRFENIMADVGADHTDGKTKLVALFAAFKKHVGSLKDLHQVTIHTLNIKLHGTVSPLSAEVVRGVQVLAEAGPSNLSTPLRKALSMGAYPTPDSRPRCRDAHVVSQSPPPSPSPLGPRDSFGIDADYADQLAQQPIIPFQTVRLSCQDASPAPNPSNADLEMELAAVKVELRQTQEQLGWYRTELEREKARHAPAQELIVKLEAEVSKLEADKKKMERKQQRFRAKLNKLVTEGVSDSELHQDDAIETFMFRNVKYHLPSTLAEERQRELAALLTAHHAERADSVFDATHIITNSETFEGWQDINMDSVKIVSELWVERSIAAKKMQQAEHYSVSKLFSGVIACSADLRQSDEEVISAGVLALGGQWRWGLIKDVTHLFAVMPTSDKYSTGMSYRNQTHIKVLVPDWFDDSVLLGTRNLDTEAYEWPNPAVLTRRPLTPTRLKQAQRNSMSPQKKALYKTATLDDPSKALSGQRIAKNVWGGRRILLSTNLELVGSRRKIVEQGIVQAKGVLVKYSSNNGDGTPEEEQSLLEDCDVFITRYRTERVFYEAYNAGKIIGTLSWLLNAHVTGVQTSPVDQILHYPVPKGNVEGFEKHLISVTNYTGEMRDYIKKLITLMGGDFTPSLSHKNTVLIAAHQSGPKTAKAAEWSIPVVNHTWLEDCFIRWQNLTPALEKYVSYPPGVDFSSLLGERGFGPEIENIVAMEAADFTSDKANNDHDPQVSADETEVEGGLMPAVDVDVDMDGIDPLEDFPEDHDDRMSFEGHDDLMSDEPSRPAAGPSTLKLAAKSPAKPKFTPTAKPRSSLKNGIRPLSASSESPEPEIVRKAVTRTAPLSKSTPKKKGKGRETDSDSEPEAQSVSVSRPARKSLVRRVTGLAPPRSPSSTQPEQTTPRKSPPGPRPLDDSDSDEDFPAATFAAFAKAPKPKTPVRGGVIKATRLSASMSHAPPTKSGAKKKIETPRNVAATPTPPSSPLSPATPSPKALRVPTAQVSVVVPHVKDTISASARRGPPGRTESVSVMSPHRAITSAPPRSRGTRNPAPRAPSPASSVGTSSVAAPENGRAKRTAAVNASQLLRDKIMPDVINFQNEMRSRGRKIRRVSGRMEGDEESENADEPSSKRRKLAGGKEKRRGSTSDDESIPEPPPKPRPRKSEVALRNGKPIKLLTTGLPPGSELSDGVLKALAKLGAKMTNRPTECTHLIVPSLVRTEKFLCALTVAPYILTKEWAVDSAAKEELMPEEEYLLRDDAGDVKFQCNLSDAVSRAKTLKGKLFQDHSFYMTPHVKTREILRNVILANGGQTIATQPTLRLLENDPRRHVISCEEDKAIWQQIATVHPIYTVELILTCALRQQVDWEDFRVPGSVL
ncbi:Brct domain containing protein [Mycena sanguinolenta]|uniref:Brct domain containing protein n=1 Tax=Mycena sanguinolenta TaxID=230812 RepID=A0A8H6Y2U8_9AGAR|nr:Brct domain containing protein [Mycena sanguinolenta]